MKKFNDLQFKVHPEHSRVIYAQQKLGVYTLWIFSMIDSDHGKILGNHKKGTYEVCCLSGKDKYLPLTKDNISLCYASVDDINFVMKKLQTKGVKAWAINLKRKKEKFDKAQKRNRLVV